jgi:hypothetical protein
VFTVTVAEHWIAPPEPIAVPVYVVSPLTGGLVVDPLPTEETPPIPLSMVKLVAFAVAHESVVVSPLDITIVGDTESRQVGPVEPPPVLIATLTVQVAVPPGPCTVPVKVVSEVIGWVEVAPLVIGESVPRLLSIEKLVASVVVQETIEVPPEFTVDGNAVREHVGALTFVVTVTVVEHCLLMPLPVTVAV